MTRGDQNKFRWQFRCLEQANNQKKIFYIQTVWQFMHDWQKEKTKLIVLSVGQIFVEIGGIANQSHAFQ